MYSKIFHFFFVLILLFRSGFGGICERGQSGILLISNSKAATPLQFRDTIIHLRDPTAGDDQMFFI